MPREIVQKAIQLSNRKLILHGQDPAHDLEITGSRVYFATGGAAVMIADPKDDTYRDSLAQDLYDMHIIQILC